ncbi:MAG: hypothetical protein IPH80_27980 [Myxococcales bacterium]|nr:hypothetical protein [Myxococcales bacterium]
MTPDQYLQSQLMPMLQPGEQVLHTAYMRRQPGLLVQLLFIGGLLLFLITSAYFVVLTNRRVILIRTKMSFWSGGPKLMNLGVEQWDVRNLRGCTTSGFANNRSMSFQMHDGRKDTLRISPWNKKIYGTAAFLEQVPGLINSGQLQHLAMAAGPAPMPPAPPQLHAGPFAPGTRVTITAPDGSRYPATVVTFAQGQYQCTLGDGASHWFPAPSVGVA